MLSVSGFFQNNLQATGALAVALLFYLIVLSLVLAAVRKHQGCFCVPEMLSDGWRDALDISVDTLSGD